MLKRPELLEGFQGKVFKDRVREGGCDQLADILPIGWWCGNGESTSSASRTFWFQPSEVYVLVGTIQLTSSTWWVFQSLQNSSKDVAENIIYSP